MRFTTDRESNWPPTEERPGWGGATIAEGKRSEALGTAGARLPSRVSGEGPNNHFNFSKTVSGENVILLRLGKRGRKASGFVKYDGLELGWGKWRKSRGKRRVSARRNALRRVRGSDG